MKLCGFEVGLDRPFFLIAGPCGSGLERASLHPASKPLRDFPAPGTTRQFLAVTTFVARLNANPFASA